MTTLSRSPIPRRPERLFTTAEYLRMVETGILTENDKVELLNGRIVEKMARNPPHDSAIQRLLNALVRKLPQAYSIRSQMALTLPSSASVPEPDLAVVWGPDSRYDAAHPGAADALLVVEISDSTLRDDRGEKLISYAGAGVSLYWIVNLVDRRVEIYSDPTGPEHFPTYRRRDDADEKSTVTLRLPEGEILESKVVDLLPALPQQ
jgi:Uma2 family endonuclease